MKVDVISAAMPPALDGIGDYTARLAAAAAHRAAIRVLVGSENADAVPGVEIVHAFDAARPESVQGLPAAVAGRRPNWVVLQYNPFSFGPRGKNPWLADAMAEIQSAGARVALMAHETYVPPTNWKFAIMGLWQRNQFRSLCATADVVFTSIEGWAAEVRARFPAKRVCHLPVGSNIPSRPSSRHLDSDRHAGAARKLVVGLFSAPHARQMMPGVRTAIDRAAGSLATAEFLYIGAHGALVGEALAGYPFRQTGILPAAEVSDRLAEIDIFIAPYIDGISTRRSAFMAALQHECAAVATSGYATDEMLKREDGSAFLLCPAGDTKAMAVHLEALASSADLRKSIGAGGAALYQREFDWPVIVEKMFSELCAASPR